MCVHLIGQCIWMKQNEIVVSGFIHVIIESKYFDRFVCQYRQAIAANQQVSSYTMKMNLIDSAILNAVKLS